MSERVRQHLAGEPDRDVQTVRRALRLLTVTPGREGEAAIDRIEQRLREPGRARVGSEREGFKQRVAHIEVLMREALRDDTNLIVAKSKLDQALREVRGLLDETP